MAEEVDSACRETSQPFQRTAAGQTEQTSLQASESSSQAPLHQGCSTFFPLPRPTPHYLLPPPSSPKQVVGFALTSQACAIVWGGWVGGKGEGHKLAFGPKQDQEPWPLKCKDHLDKAQLVLEAWELL